MNLIELRTKFRDLSGRYDLVNTNFSDNGADFFINEGSKFLDRLDETSKSWASCFRFIEIGRSNVSFPHCRAIKEVWAASVTERWQLEKKRYQDLMLGYLADLPSERGTGSPLYYSPCFTRYIPENATVVDIEAFSGFVDVTSGNAGEYNAIILNVPSDIKLMIDIRGLFYSAKLAIDADKNYWSEVHPMLLIMSAMRSVEIVNRNTQGVNDWNNSISTEMKQLGMDLVEQMIAETDQMEG